MSTLSSAHDAAPIDANQPSESAESQRNLAPHPGAQTMPRWNVGELVPPPKFSWRNWAAMIGPGLVMGGAAIGGGEWLKGPEVTARYGGGLLWLATLSILGQVIYNLEISRYTLYSGEPIFTGKFRTLPGPRFWLCVYLVLDFGALFPYLAANAATPLAAVLLGHLPDPDHSLFDKRLLQVLAYVIFLGGLTPLAFGGKVYNSLKALMTFKIVVVLGFLTLVAVMFSGWETWSEIASGFVRFGTLPVVHPEAAVDEAQTHVENLLLLWWRGEAIPPLDLSLVVAISAMVAIAGSGGLSNTPVSNYTRDQGWGMGHHVGAIPSAFGGHKISLSHVGSVFEPTAEALPRWRQWYRHVMRDQLFIWMPACFIGLALPSMLSVEFLPRGSKAHDWTAAGMTADGVWQRVAESSVASWAGVFWFMTLFCGFLVLGLGVVSSADGLIRRWVDVFWTSSPRLRKLDPHRIRNVYFGVLLVYALFGVVMLSVGKPNQLLNYAALILNFALGFSCWHTLVINHALLPRPLRPGLFASGALLLAGLFFNVMATVASLHTLGLI